MILEAINKALDRTEEAVTSFLGSRAYVLLLTAFSAGWMSLNAVAWFHHWDPYPFILLNLVYSTAAAYQQAFILLVQNRQERRAKEEAVLKQQETEEFRQRAEVTLKAIAAHGPVIIDISKRQDTTLDLVEGVYQLLESLHERIKTLESSPSAARTRGDGNAAREGLLSRPRPSGGIGDLSPDQG